MHRLLILPTLLGATYAVHAQQLPTTASGETTRENETRRETQAADRKSLNDALSADMPGLNEILVAADPLDAQIQSLPAAYIRSSARSDLAEALSIIPSVRVAESASSSRQQGDIKPAEFSIRGASPYQNRFVLDGASVDNLLDPAQSERADNYTRVAGHSQGQFIDTRFLQNIEVSDTNISAREGGFTGGVVKAETRAYAGRNEAHVSYRGTSDSLTNLHIDKTQEREFESAAAQMPNGVPGEFQPDFRKSEFTLDGAARVGDIGIFAGYSEKRSTITQKQLLTMDLDNFRETGQLYTPSENRTLDNKSRYGVVRMDLLDRDYELNASLSYTNFDKDSFLINYLDSDFVGGHEGINLSVNYGNYIGATRVDVNFNAGQTSDEHDYDRHTLTQYKSTSIFDGGIIGGLGDLENQQRKLGGSLTFTTPINDIWTTDYGAEIAYLDYEQHRDQDFVAEDYRLDYSQTPLPDPIGPGSYAPADQYQSRVATYRAGDIAFSNTNGAVFGELAADGSRFFGRAGLRVERDGLLENTNAAPRLKAGVYLDNSQNMRLIAGANRYYGKSFLSYKLRAEERRLVEVRERDNPNDPFTAVADRSDYDYRDLDTPYDDEYSLGIAGTLWHGDIGLTYVRRQGQDQIRTNYDGGSELYNYDNSGRSTTDQVDLYWRSQPFAMVGANWGVNLGVSWMDKETDASYGDDDKGYNDIPNDEDVVFQGRRVRRSELPARDFATPVSAQVDVITSAFNDRLWVRNALSYTDGYRYLLREGSDPATGLQRYDIEKQDNTLRWDLSTRLALLPGAHSPYIGVDVLNVTDSRNIVRSESGVQLFGVGRQYWLEVGYDF
ncbi:putative exported iron receptor protein [Salinisphaera shabanensis T35B1]|uniref:TonB-dependent receptor plug domain-containing protein n=1 Tax=Salinisphaera shabanensis TaxID=180542 RepID=UPI003340667B